MGKEVPTVFIEAFVNGFETPKAETDSEKIVSNINRKFIARRLNWRDWTNIMCE